MLVCEVKLKTTTWRYFDQLGPVSPTREQSSVHSCVRTREAGPQKSSIRMRLNVTTTTHEANVVAACSTSHRLVSTRKAREESREIAGFYRYGTNTGQRIDRPFTGQVREAQPEKQVNTFWLLFQTLCYVKQPSAKQTSIYRAPDISGSCSVKQHNRFHAGTTWALLSLCD